MDKYCRTCMRDSIKFSPIFEEMTYGGISLQEAIEDVCQLEVTIDDGLPSYVCRDCALKLYDIVRFKMEAHEVYSALKKLMAIHPPIKMEIEESIEESSLLSPETENIKVEEFFVSHSNEGSYNTVTDPFGNTNNPDAGNANFEPTQSRVSVENRLGGIDSFEASLLSPKTENIKVEEFCVSHSIEGSFNAVTDPFGNTTNSDAGNANFEPIQSRVNVGNSIRGTDTFEDEMPRLILEDSDVEEEIVEGVNIDPGDMENNNAAIFRDTHVLPSILAVESGTLKIPESIDNGNLREEIFQKNTQGIDEGKGYLCSQTLHPNEKEFEGDEIQIEVRKSDSRDVSLTCINYRISLLDETEKGNPMTRENYCYSDGSHLNPERIEDNETTERGNVDSNSILKQREGGHEDGTSNLFEATAESVGLGTSVPTGVDSYICHVCDERFCKKSVLKKHERTHFVEEQFQCEVCSRKFRMEDTLQRHQKIHELCRKYFRGIDRNDINASCSSEIPNQGSTKELDKQPINVGDTECKNINKNPTIFIGSKVPLTEGGNGEYPESWICDRCRKEFWNKKDILEHLNLHYGRRSSSKCLLPVVRKKEKKVRDSNVFNRNMEENVLSRRNSYGKKLVVDSELKIPEMAGESKSAEKPFACQYCSKVFRSPSDRNTHQRIHSGEKPFACKYCAKMFSQTSNRNQHELSHTGEKPFACKYCAKMFSQKSIRNQHELTHTGEKPFACKYCAKMFSQKSDRNRHELTHTGEKPFACKYCAKMFSQKYNRNQHELTHTGEKPFACKFCAKMFSRNSDRNQHELTHTGEKLFACKYCSKLFSTTSNRKKHERIHSGEKPFACKYCSRMFVRSSDRNQHELTHTGEKPFACKCCSKKFRTTSHRKNHERIHSGEKPFACKYCSKMFSTTSNRKKHERIHSGEKPFACKYCSRMFVRSSDRNQHELTHTEEKPFACKCCSKKFRTTSHRKNHERIHSGEKPFARKYCSETFSQKSNRIQHERIHSGEKPL